jgi:CxxC motif-containing protein (DUF1111 family)
VFKPIGCATCHVGALGDFLLHNIGTGDGSTRNQVRTAPLWGIGARTRFMRDGASLRVSAAIARHGARPRPRRATSRTRARPTRPTA